MDNRRGTSLAEDAAERDIEKRWDKDAALRAEFVDDYDACVCYHQAVARGVAHHTKANVRALGTIEDARPATSAPVEAPGHQGRAVAAPAIPPGAREDEVRRALQRHWNANAALRAEYADDFTLFEAFEKASATGRVKVFAPGRRDVVVTAAAPVAAPAVAAPDATINARRQKIVAAWAAAWYQDPALQEEYASADAYIEALKAKYWRAS